MQILYEQCAAVDVGKDVIAIAVRLPRDGPGSRQTVKRTFKTFYGVLREAARWLDSLGVTHVAMEATGIYSMPVYHALVEHGHFEQVLVCNAGHVKNVPGRKTDLLTELPEGLGEVSGQAAIWVATVADHDRRWGSAAGSVAAGGAAGGLAGGDRRSVRAVPAGRRRGGVVGRCRRTSGTCRRAGGRRRRIRSYGMDLLRWWRFLRAVGVGVGSGDPG